MALFIFFFIDIEVEKSEKKLTFTQEFGWVSKQETNKEFGWLDKQQTNKEFGWVNKQQTNKQIWLDKEFGEQQQTTK